MFKQFVENWEIIVFMIGSLVALGKLLQSVLPIDKRLVEAEDQLNPKDPSKRLVTISQCEKCRYDCEKRNVEQFRELKVLRTGITEKRDDYVAALGDVSCRLGRIEGKLDK